MSSSLWAALVSAVSGGAAAIAYLHAASAYLNGTSISLEGLPALWPIYYRVLVSLLTKPQRLRGQQAALPPKRITTGTCDVHGSLRQLLALCDAPVNPHDDVPLLLPAVLSFRLCMAAMAAPSFPVSVLGGVLSGYRAVQLRRIPTSEPLCFSMELQPELRTSDTGNNEYDITVSAALASGEVVWRDCSTFTVIAGRRGRAAKQAPQQQETTGGGQSWRQLAEWRLGSDAGRRFAAINGDINPIHMAAWCARLFGFRSNIVHGMLLLARFVQTAQAAGLATECPRGIAATLRRPALLPATVQCRVREGDSALHGGTPAGWPQQFSSGVEFAMSAADAPSGKDSITGQLLWGLQKHKL